MKAGDVLRVQEDVARQVAGNLELRISAETDGRFDSRRSRTAQAQELYLNARRACAARIDTASQRAGHYAVSAGDPRRPIIRARQGLGWQHAIAQSCCYFMSQRTEDLLSSASCRLLAEAETAPQLVDLYVVRGGDLHRSCAERELCRALICGTHSRISPNTVGEPAQLGYSLILTGESRASTELLLTDARALRSPRFRLAGVSMHGAHRHGEVRRSGKRLRPGALRTSRVSPWVYSVLGLSLDAARGRWLEALRYSEQALERDNDIAEIHGERALAAAAPGS